MTIRLAFICLLLGSIALQAPALQSGDNTKIEADKLYNEANALFKSGNYSAAVQKYDAAIKLFKDDFKYHYQRGLSLKNNKQLEESINAFKEALLLKPDLSIGHNAMGGVFVSLKQFDNAITSFQTALQHDRTLSQARVGLGEAIAGKSQELLNGGKYEDALALLIQATADHTENAKIYLILASAYNKTDKPKDAVDAALNAVKFKKKGGKGAEFFELGIAYKKLGQKDKARGAFAEARKDATYARNAQYELDGLR